MHALGAAIQLVASIITIGEITYLGVRALLRRHKKRKVRKRRLFTLKRLLVVVGAVLTFALLFVSTTAFKITIGSVILASALGVMVLDYRSEEEAPAPSAPNSLGGSSGLEGDLQPVLIHPHRPPQAEPSQELPPYPDYTIYRVRHHESGTSEHVGRQRLDELEPGTYEIIDRQVPERVGDEPPPRRDPPPVDPGPELPGRTLSDEEWEFLLKRPSNRPEEDVAKPPPAWLLDPELSEALGRARRVTHALQELLDEVALPDLSVLRDSRKNAVWQLEQEQVKMGRYMAKLHPHVLTAVDGLRAWGQQDELDLIYRTPRSTGDLRMVVMYLNALADLVQDHYEQ
jgi:hypothetical protein